MRTFLFWLAVLADAALFHIEEDEEEPCCEA